MSALCWRLPVLCNASLLILFDDMIRDVAGENATAEHSGPAGVCADDEFLCRKDKKCIPRQWVCDGDNDCNDNSDERDCSKHLRWSLGQTQKFPVSAQCTCISGGFSFMQEFSLYLFLPAMPFRFG